MNPVSALSAAYTEIRCPYGPRKLLAKIKTEGGIKRMSAGNLLELSCRDCTHEVRKAARLAGRAEPLRILHRFDLSGALVETVEGE